MGAGHTLPVAGLSHTSSNAHKRHVPCNALRQALGARHRYPQPHPSPHQDSTGARSSLPPTSITTRSRARRGNLSSNSSITTGSQGRYQPTSDAPLDPRGRDGHSRYGGNPSSFPIRWKPPMTGVDGCRVVVQATGGGSSRRMVEPGGEGSDAARLDLPLFLVYARKSKWHQHHNIWQPYQAVIGMCSNVHVSIKCLFHSLITVLVPKVGLVLLRHTVSNDAFVYGAPSAVPLERRVDLVVKEPSLRGSCSHGVDASSLGSWQD